MVINFSTGIMKADGEFPVLTSNVGWKIGKLCPAIIFAAMN
jgi:hypothetical protein